VKNEIAYRTPGAQIPSRLRKARNHFEFTPEQRAEIMESYFREQEGLKDLAKRWWRLLKERSLSAQDLAEELERLRKLAGHDKEWRINIRRTAGCNHQESWLMDPRIDWEMKQDPRGAIRVGKLFQTVGMQPPRSLEEILARVLETTQDGKESCWALKELRESRLVRKEKWQEWNKLIHSRFKETEDEAEEMKEVTRKEMIEVLRKLKNGDSNWSEGTEDWEARMKQGTAEAIIKMKKAGLRYAKPRLKAPGRLWIEVITNRPIKSRITKRWKVMRIEVEPVYKIEEIYHKVKSRWKDRWKVIWEEDEIDQWQVWGQEGQLGRDSSREWIDGERMILLQQQRGDTLVPELSENLRVKIKWREKLLQGWTWKKREWKKWAEANPDWSQEWRRPEEWLPGEQQWFEGEEGWHEQIRRGSRSH
jgi:hypothetical protein